MKINFSKEAGTLKISVEGRIDTTTAPELDAFLSRNTDGVDALVIDCKNLAYVSSAGLRVFLSTHKKMKGSMKLANVGEVVMEVLEMTGFADILVIE